MKWLHGFALLFAALPISWLLASSTAVKDIAVSIVGFGAAIGIALAVTGGLCLLTHCRAPHATAAAPPRSLPRILSSDASTASGRQARLHQTHRKQG